MTIRSQTRWLGVIVAFATVAIGTAATARADGLPAGPAARADGPVPMPPGFMDGIDVTEHVRARVPLDTAFRDHTGREVTLGTVVHGDLPVLVTFNYSSCPGLCDMHLNALADALAQARFSLGR